MSTKVRNSNQINQIMKKVESILVSLCFGFIAVSCVRLLVHILATDIKEPTDIIAFMPVALFIGFLFYMGGTLCLDIVKDGFKRDNV